jgi:hypothetical protein
MNITSLKKSSSGGTRKHKSQLVLSAKSSNSDSDIDSDDHKDENNDCEASSSTDQQLLESSFPYMDALLYGTDHNQNQPFECTDASIEFVCHHLCLHGFGFVLDAQVDSYQPVGSAHGSILKCIMNHEESIDTIPKQGNG